MAEESVRSTSRYAVGYVVTRGKHREQHEFVHQTTRIAQLWKVAFSGTSGGPVRGNADSYVTSCASAFDLENHQEDEGGENIAQPSSAEENRHASHLSASANYDEGCGAGCLNELDSLVSLRRDGKFGVAVVLYRICT